MSFEQNSAPEDFFLCACGCWAEGVALREMDQSFELYATIGYRDSNLEVIN